MKPILLDTTGDPQLALVYLLQVGPEPSARVETVDSIDPRFSRAEKSVIILSTQFGCPVGCRMCDAGHDYGGNLSVEQMLDQVRFVLHHRPEALAAEKLKIHFARMGEPALNDAVLQALEELPAVVPARGLIPCIASVAPIGRRDFFERLIDVKERHYPGRFQLQFSINSTDESVRRRLMPIAQLDPETIAELGQRFHGPADRKIVLNFALARGVPCDPARLAETFDPEHFMVKLTPINPTAAAEEAGLSSVLSPLEPAAAEQLVEELRHLGYLTIVSIGAPEEIEIGSNCGQLVRAYSKDANSEEMHSQQMPPPGANQGQDLR